MDYLEQRQYEDREALREVSRNTTATAETLAVVHEQIGALQERHERDRTRADAEHVEMWKGIDRGRELGVRAILAVLAIAIGYVIAAYGAPHP